MRFEYLLHHKHPRIRAVACYETLEFFPTITDFIHKKELNKYEVKCCFERNGKYYIDEKAYTVIDGIGRHTQ